MHHLNGWTILNLKNRLDRRLISVMQARMLQVPIEDIEIWEAKDAKALGITNRDELVDAIADDGFPEFREHKHLFGNKHLGQTCHLWNVCRYLRRTIETGETRMFIHDGVCLNNSVRNFMPIYSWMNEVVRILKEVSKNEGTPFRVFLSGHRQPRYVQPYDPISPGSFIMKGILSSDNFARIYSPEGAEFVLERFLSHPVNHTNAILGPREHEDDTFFQTPGFYSTLVPLFTDCPSDWLGANTRDNLTSYTGEYARVFPREMLPEEWLTYTEGVPNIDV